MKAFITVVGKDRVGIIAAVSGLLSQLNINIEDISQTIMQGMFTMVMAVELGQATLAFEDVAAKLLAEGEKLGIEISIRHKDIFEAMHRI
ncbi:MAG: ACT domain-containing protein [Clostridia bacterium]